MRHVMVMTMTGAAGLTFMFLIDAATLFWVSQLRVERYMAALGYAWTIQFFTVSSGIGFMIAATALVARSLGQGNWAEARKQTSSSAIISVGVQVAFSLIVLLFREPILRLAGAEGETLAEASRFLFITLPSLPFLAMGMIGSAVLRAQGDGVRSMYVTLSSGVVAMVIDPVLVFGLNLGVVGAAWGVVIARSASACLSVWFVIRIHDLAAPVNAADIRRLFGPFFAIAIPAVLTQMASPFGNYIVTRLISVYGDGAMAGWAVVARVTVLTFGGVFSLSGAVGAIIGQNYGAGLFDRVKQTYRDALVFSAGYTLVAWGLLAALTGPVVLVFGLGPEGADVVRAFTRFAAAGFVFTGAMFVSNAAFNNLGKPLYSTGFNWLRDGVFLLPCGIVFGLFFAAPGVIYGQAAASVIVGSLSAHFGWKFVCRLERAARPTTPSPARAPDS